MERSDEARREDSLYDRISQVCQSNRKLEAENKTLKRPMESVGFNTDGMLAVGQELIDQDIKIKELKTENEKFKIALQDISYSEDSRNAHGVGYDITIDVIAKIALGDI